MAEAKRTLSGTMASLETGELLTRGVRPFEVAYKGARIMVDLPGYYPAGEGEGVHVGDDMRVVDEALRELKRRVEGVPMPAEIRALRKKLKLSQRADMITPSGNSCLRSDTDECNCVPHC